MNEVKRWTHEINAGAKIQAIESPDGDYVLYSDYAAVAAERDAMRADRDAIFHNHEVLQAAAVRMIDELTAERDHLETALRERNL